MDNSTVCLPACQGDLANGKLTELPANNEWLMFDMSQSIYHPHSQHPPMEERGKGKRIDLWVLVLVLLCQPAVVTATTPWAIM